MLRDFEHAVAWHQLWGVAPCQRRRRRCSCIRQYWVAVLQRASLRTVQRSQAQPACVDGQGGESSIPAISKERWGERGKHESSDEPHIS